MTASNSCFHCEEALPPDNPQRFSAQIGNTTQYFCCPACAAVADAIHNLGLDQYYRQRDSKPQRPASGSNEPATETHTNAAYTDIDLLVEQPATSANSFLHLRDDSSCEAQLFIPDIHCASCCWLIEKRLQKLDGVIQADTQLNTHKLTVRWQKNHVLLSDIFRALHEIGYRAVPWQPTQQQTTLHTQQKKLLQRLGVAGLLAMQIHMVAMGSYFGALPNMQQWMNSVALLLSLPIWFYSADLFFISAWRSLKNIRNVFRTKTDGTQRNSWRTAFAGSMDVPVALAIVAAALNSIIGVVQGTDDVYFDSIAMFVFLLLGARYLEAQARSRLAVFAQDPVLPQACTRMRDGQPQRVTISALQQHDTVLVQTGIIPVDGIVLSGSAAIEQAAITGEFLPVQKQVGDHVIAGTALVSGELLVEAHRWGANSHIADLHRRMERALANKQDCKIASPTFSATNLYDTVAQFFTPVVLLIASASAAYWYWAAPAKALPAFLAVLVASCPCALTLAIPAALTAATLQLRRRGILVTGGHVLQGLPAIAHYVFDKTGTLTQGRMHILHIQTCADVSTQECLAIATALEQHATHPAASAFKQSNTGNPTAFFHMENITPVLHCGIEGIHNGKHYRIGKAAWACEHWACEHAAARIPAQLHDNDNDIRIVLACNGNALAVFTLGDPLRSDSHNCIQQLQQQTITCSIVSGDHSNAVEGIAAQLSITDVHKNCSPTEKVAIIEQIKKMNGAVIMVGDGINDGPVLAHATISIALAEASQTAQLAADVILLNNHLQDLVTLRNMALRTRRIARQNLAWALLYNAGILPLAAAGYLSPVSAAIGMALSSLLVTANALRLFATGKQAQ